MTTASRTYLTVTGLLFAVVAIVHVWRALAGFDLAIGGHVVPQFASWPIAILFGLLATWGLRQLRG